MQRRHTLALGMALALPAAGARAHGAAHAAPPAASAAPVVTDWGRSGDPARVSRTVVIDMHDRMRYTPDRVDVALGRTLRLRVRNRGRLRHELVIGTRDELQRHAELMQKFPDMEHDAPYMAHVDPGRSVDLVWTFDREGDILYGCLLPGHWQAGMQGRFMVRA